MVRALEWAVNVMINIIINMIKYQYNDTNENRSFNM